MSGVIAAKCAVGGCCKMMQHPLEVCNYLHLTDVGAHCVRLRATKPPLQWVVHLFWIFRKPNRRGGSLTLPVISPQSEITIAAGNLLVAFTGSAYTPARLREGRDPPLQSLSHSSEINHNCREAIHIPSQSASLTAPPMGEPFRKPAGFRRAATFVTLG